MDDGDLTKRKLASAGGSIIFGTERATASKSHPRPHPSSTGLKKKKMGMGSISLPIPLAGAAVARLSNFPSPSSGTSSDSLGLSRSFSRERSLQHLLNSLQRRAFGFWGGANSELHREEVGGASNHFCKTTLGNLGSIDGKAQGVSQIRG